MRRRVRLLAGALFVVGLCAWLVPSVAAEQAPQPLVLEATIPLPDTGGRIDHMAVDLRRRSGCLQDGQHGHGPAERTFGGGGRGQPGRVQNSRPIPESVGLERRNGARPILPETS